MHLVVIGLNHKTAKVEMREKLSIDDTQLPKALAEVRSLSRISECVILSTCNRTEIYACARTRSDDALIIDWLGSFCSVSAEELRPHLYSWAGHKAAEHLFRVAGGIDSMVIGEYQILGQVKAAHAAASRAGCTGVVLNYLFQQAAAVGKRIRSETTIARGAFSIGSVAVQFAVSIFNKLRDRTVLVIGAGKVAELTITHLKCAGAGKVLVANRTKENAEALAAQCGGQAVSFEDLESALNKADIVIASTGSSQPIVTRRMVTDAISARRGRPMLMIDIAVPRDIEPSVGNLDGVFVYNIDDLQSVVDKNMVNRKAEVESAEAIIAQEVRRFIDRFRTLDAVPVITALREKFEGIRQAELEKLQNKLRNLSDEQRDAIDAATRSIVNKICHHPMIQIKDYAASESPPITLEQICELFGICPDILERSGDATDCSEYNKESAYKGGR
ncbi:MAG: glutamyl-tRNA reductase [Armatimonadetes bacterium]|nr:glutamyl-tRNA reductase [Armatimonadota bacterium]